MVRSAFVVGHATFDMYTHELVNWDILMQHERFRAYDLSGVSSNAKLKLCCAALRMRQTDHEWFSVSVEFTVFRVKGVTEECTAR